MYSTLPPSHATHLRIAAAQILAHLLTHYSMTYPSLPIKVVKTLIVGLIEDKKSRATHEGAIRGLMAIGKEAVRLGLISREGAKVVGEKCLPGESSELVDLVMVGTLPSLYVLSLIFGSVWIENAIPSFGSSRAPQPELGSRQGGR